MVYLKQFNFPFLLATLLVLSMFSAPSYAFDVFQECPKMDIKLVSYHGVIPADWCKQWAGMDTPYLYCVSAKDNFCRKCEDSSTTFAEDDFNKFQCQ